MPDHSSSTADAVPTRTHRLKTWPEYFEAIRRGEKRFEIRKDDRGFAVGDVLVLLEWDPSKRAEGLVESDGYTHRAMRCTVTYKMPGGRFGLDTWWCVLGISEPTEERFYEKL